MRSRLLPALPALVLAAAGCGAETGTSDPPPASSAAASTVGPGWRTLPPGPLSGRIGSSVLGLDERHVLVVGGWEWLCPPTADCFYPDSPRLADGAVVDLATGEWREVADAPFGFSHAVGAVLDGDAFLLASCRSGADCTGPAELLRYDPDADTWDVLATVPRGRSGVSALVPYDGRLLAVSGTDEQGESADRLLDPVTGAGTDLPDDPLPEVFDRFVVADGDRLLAFGSTEGEGGGKLAAAYDGATGTWTRLPGAPSEGYQAWSVAGRVWLNGHFGDDGGAVLDPATGTWGPLPADRPSGAGDLAGVVGDGEAAYEYDHGWVVDAVRGRWVEVPDQTPATYDETVAAVGSALVVAGGQDWSERADGPAGRLVADVRVWRPKTG
ncbi:Kelch repeat-containing protein [Nocardioides dongkuii]|uniref:Kelch repeat-containing protein n=1 Tax=Nocardioides dongkuii TaxID=2760089 RepID=UPI0015F9BE4B|nr:hypothetical protein [Nocardioides dongkuii]